MSIIYRIQQDDTVEKISRKFYGSEIYVNNILQANPGILINNLQVNTDISIPQF